MSDPAAPGPGERALAQPGLESAPEPPPETAAAAPPIEAQSERNLAAGPQPHSLVTRPLVAPTFGQIKRPGHAWGVPLVSSFLFTTGCLALMRLL
jgi:hypothetical protein